MNNGIPNSLESVLVWTFEQSPFLESVGHKIYRRYTHIYLRYLEERYGIENYDAPIDRRELLWVNPQKIQKVNDPGFFVKRDTIEKVIGGDWDKGLPEFNQVFPYRSFEKHFIDGVPWEKTEMHDWVHQNIRAGRTWGNCTTMAEANKRFEKLDILYENIKDHGYKTQHELVESGEIDPFDRDLPPPYERYEIKIDIARDGELIFEDGRHRLAIAKVLEIDAVPVYVLVRHQKWQEKRDKYYHSQNPPDKPHPDLSSLQS